MLALGLVLAIAPFVVVPVVWRGVQRRRRRRQERNAMLFLAALRRRG